MSPIIDTIQFKRGTQAWLAGNNPRLLEGEVIKEIDTGREKLGPIGGGWWNDLPYTDEATIDAIASPTVTIAYNDAGQPVTVTENGVATTYTYNPDGSVASDSRAGVIRLYSYDGDGNVVAIEVE